MRSLLIKAFIFSIPVILFIGLGEYTLFKYKENMPIKTVVANQIKSKQESYYSRYFFDSSPTLYKLEMAKEKKADILVIGRSTVLDFRAEMFHPFEDRFYNIGFAINTVADIRSVLNLIKNRKLHQPKIMIIGLDAPMIKSGIFDHVNRIDTPHEDEVYNLKLHFLAFQLLIRQLFVKDEVNLSPDAKLGFGYLGDCGVGFRKDGSRFDAVAIRRSTTNPNYRDNGSLKNLINKREYPFDYPYETNDHLVTGFLSCLADMKKSGIEPVIFFPPISDDFYNYMQKDDGFRIFFNHYLLLQKTLNNMGYDVINFKTPKDMGLNDSYMLDGIHPGDLFTGKLWLNFLNKTPPSGMLKSIDTNYLNKIMMSKNAVPISFMTDTLIFSRK